MFPDRREISTGWENVAETYTRAHTHPRRFHRFQYFAKQRETLDSLPDFNSLFRDFSRCRVFVFFRSFFVFILARRDKGSKGSFKIERDSSLTESRRAANQESKVGWFDNYKWQVNLSLSLSLSLSLATKRSINFSHSFSRNTGFPL